MQQRRDAAAKDFAGKTNFDASFGNLKQGVTFTQPDLAAVLTRIADEGAEDFYNGETADLIAASMRGHGLITKHDLQEYRAVWRHPVLADWNGYRVITAPPPSSGGIGLVQLLKMKADLRHERGPSPLSTAYGEATDERRVHQRRHRRVALLFQRDARTARPCPSSDDREQTAQGPGRAEPGGGGASARSRIVDEQ